MKKIKINQIGFGSIEALLAILILVIVGFGGYYVYHNQRSDKSTHASTQTAKQTPTKADLSTASSNELIISEWGVKLTFKNADKVTYQLHSETQADGSHIAELMLKNSVTTISDCQDLQTALIQSSYGPASSTVHLINGHYYHIAGDPSPCTGPNGNENLAIDQQRTDMLTAVDKATIEAE